MKLSGKLGQKSRVGENRGRKLFTTDNPDKYFSILIHNGKARLNDGSQD